MIEIVKNMNSNDILETPKDLDQATLTIIAQNLHLGAVLRTPVQILSDDYIPVAELHAAQSLIQLRGRMGEGESPYYGLFSQRHDDREPANNIHKRLFSEVSSPEASSSDAATQRARVG